MADSSDIEAKNANGALNVAEPSELPIRRFTREITDAVAINPVTVVIADTGSGKTTQISQMLLAGGLSEDGLIGITQPRRVAAVTVARRVAFEMGCECGTTVGYTIRFEDRCSPDTKIKYLTDGCLIRECLEDPQLRKYSVIVLDEAHERSIDTDILFGLLKQFSRYFDDCPVFQVPGRCFPVDISYLTEAPMSYIE
eukprot:gene15401-18224_t